MREKKEVSDSILASPAILTQGLPATCEPSSSSRGSGECMFAGKARRLGHVFLLSRARNRYGNA
jgi:hypothetical protein